MDSTLFRDGCDMLTNLVTSNFLHQISNLYFSVKVLDHRGLSLRAPCVMCSFILYRKSVHRDPAIPQNSVVSFFHLLGPQRRGTMFLRKFWHVHISLGPGLLQQERKSRLFVTHSRRRSHVSVSPKCPGPFRRALQGKCPPLLSYVHIPARTLVPPGYQPFRTLVSSHLRCIWPACSSRTSKSSGS